MPPTSNINLIEMIGLLSAGLALFRPRRRALDRGLQ